LSLLKLAGGEHRYLSCGWIVPPLQGGEIFRIALRFSGAIFVIFLREKGDCWEYLPGLLFVCAVSSRAGGLLAGAEVDDAAAVAL
jgi:hypothetical protein